MKPKPEIMSSLQDLYNLDADELPLDDSSLKHLKHYSNRDRDKTKLRKGKRERYHEEE